MSSKNSTAQTSEDRSQSLGPVAAVMITGALLALISITIAGVAIPDVVADLGLDLAVAQYVGSAYLLAAGVGIVLSGWASLRWGVRTTWIVSLALFTVGALGAAVATGPFTLISARAVQGLGGGVLEPLMLTALARAAGPKRMGAIMGSVAAVMSLGPLAGPVIGGVLTSALSWRWTFGAVGIVAAVLLGASFVVLRLNERAPARLDLVGAALVAASSSLLLFGLSRASGPSGLDATAAVSTIAGLALLPAFVAWARRLGDRAILDLGTFRARGYASGVIVMGVLGAALYPMFFGLPLFYRDAVGLSAAAAGLLMVPLGLGTLVMMPIAGRLSDRMSARAIVWAGAGMALAGFLGFLVVPAGATWVAYAALTFVISLGLGAIGSPTVASLYRVLRPELVPSGSSQLFFMNQVCGALGVAIFGALVGGEAWSAEVGTRPFLLPLAAVVLIAIAATRLPGRSGVTEPTR